MTFESENNQKGFSLVEILIYTLLFGIVMTSVYRVLESNRATYASGERKMDVQQNARVAMDEMTRQLRMAGYYPENFDADTTNDLASPNPIHIATNAAMAVFGDADGSGTSNIFFFCLDGSTVRRGRAASGVGAYTCTSGDVLADGVTSLSFNYYAEAGATLPATPTAPFQLDGQAVGAVPAFTDLAQRGAVRRVVIALTATETVPRQAAQTYTLTSDVRLRNIN